MPRRPDTLLFMKTKNRVLALAVAYAVVAAFVAPLYLHHVNNDGISYLSMAGLMADGHGGAALNTYWNPLFPFLLSFVIRLGVAPLVAAKVVTLAAGLLVTLLLCACRRLIQVSGDLWNATIVTAALLSISYAVSYITPDLLLAALFLCYTLLMLDPRMQKMKAQPVLIALVIALAYYTKTFALPFLVLHFITLQAVRFFSDASHRKPVAIGCVIAGIATFVLVLPWVVFVSKLHGSLTIGENAKFIHAALNPLFGANTPMNTYGLIPPPHALATSMWDDPTKTVVPYWSAFDSASHAITQLKIIFLNIGLFFDLVLKPMFLVWALFCASLVLSFSRTKNQLTDLSRFIAAAFVLALALYLPFIIEERYFWWQVFLTLVLGAALLSAALHSLPAKSMQRRLAIGLFALSFLLYPAWQLAFFYRDGTTQYKNALQLDAALHMKDSRIADDNWKEGLRVSYYVDAQFYGKPKAGTDQVIEKELLENDIRFYLSDARPRTFKSYVESPTKIGGMRVFVRQ